MNKICVMAYQSPMIPWVTPSMKNSKELFSSALYYYVVVNLVILYLVTNTHRSFSFPQT
jgi:hypothetical protein